jgi:hypothetical protein
MAALFTNLWDALLLAAESFTDGIGAFGSPVARTANGLAKGVDVLRR